MQRWKQYGTFLLFLTGFAHAHAQAIVKINAGTGGECDLVNPPAGEQIFVMDVVGNLLMNGTLSGPGCVGTITTPTFGLNPPPKALTISPASVVFGASATLSYRAYYAIGCNVASSTGTASGVGICPTVSILNASCSGFGSANMCSPSSGTVSEPASLAAGISSCGYTLTATCNPGAVTSSANLTVTNPCQSLSYLGNGSGGNYNVQAAGPVTYADGTTSPSNVDFGNYTSIWNEGSTNYSWPSVAGFSVRLDGVFNGSYVGEQFVVPTDGSVVGAVKWVNNSSAQGYNPSKNAASYAVSVCRGDFGQAGTQVGANCSADISSAGGLIATVSNSPQAGYCTLTPGVTYFLNTVQASLNNVAATGFAPPVCVSGCAPWTVRQ